MYSHLDPIFKSQMRHTETLDSKRGIRREDEEDPRRRKQKDRSEAHDPDLWEDSTSVSISALRAFLKDLIAQSGTGDDRKTDDQASVKKEQDQEKPSGANAKAASAYQRTYSATHHDEVREAPPATRERHSESVKLSTEEQRAIHKLVDDLKLLEQAGHRDLVIGKNTSFLASLIAAVDTAKTEI